MTDQACINRAEKEWQLLQAHVESYEKHSLYIKLCAVVITTATLWLYTAHTLWMIVIVAILWLQDGIWKTFQARLETRLMQVEEMLSGIREPTPCQLNHDWHTHRPSSVELVMGYIKQSLRPTVAYPYVLLILLLVGQCL